MNETTSLEVIVQLPEIHETVDVGVSTEDLMLCPASSRDTLNKNEEEGLTTILETASDYLNGEDEKKIHITMTEERLNEHMLEDAELKVQGKEVDMVLSFGQWS